MYSLASSQLHNDSNDNDEERFEAVCTFSKRCYLIAEIIKQKFLACQPEPAQKIHILHHDAATAAAADDDDDFL